MKASEYMKRLNLLLEEESEAVAFEPDISITGGVGGGKKGKGNGEIDWSNPCRGPWHYYGYNNMTGKREQYANPPNTNLIMALYKFIPYCQPLSGHDEGKPNNTSWTMEKVVQVNSDILTDLEKHGLLHIVGMLRLGGGIDTNDGIPHEKKFGRIIHYMHQHSTVGDGAGLCMSQSLIALVGRALKKIADQPNWKRRIGAS